MTCDVHSYLDGTCVMCGHEAYDRDPSAIGLRDELERLRDEVKQLRAAAPVMPADLSAEDIEALRHARNIVAGFLPANTSDHRAMKGAACAVLERLISGGPR